MLTQLKFITFSENCMLFFAESLLRSRKKLEKKANGISRPTLEFNNIILLICTIGPHIINGLGILDFCTRLHKSGFFVL